MTHRTHWTPALQHSFGASHFLLNSLVFHAAYLAFRKLRPKPRNAGTVQSNYDRERAELMARLQQTSWDDYVLFPDELSDWIVVDDTTRWGRLREAREILLERLAQTVHDRVSPGQTVIEFGSGDGRNLLYLRRRFPEIRFVGLELSPVSVELSYKAAERFGIDGVEFFQANVCEPLPQGVARPDIGLIYSSFALEQMPRIFRQAIASMLALCPEAIVLFEPVPEAWPQSLRGWAGRLRSRAIDRLHELPSAVHELLQSHAGYRLARLERSGIAINPHTEMVEVVIEQVRPTQAP